MLFYILLFLCTAFIILITNLLKQDRQKRIIYILWFIGVFLISGLRFELGGSDYYIYREGFEAIPKLWELNQLGDSIENIKLVNNFEIGYLLFNSFVKTLGFNFYGFTVIESAIWYLCMYHGLKRYINDWAIVLPVFLYKLFFYNTFISLRQSITIAIFFVSWRLIQDKKIIKYYLLCILALLFHNGAIILFVVYPVMQFKLTKKRLLILNVIAWSMFLIDKLGFSIFAMINAILERIPSESTIIFKAKQWMSMNMPISIFHIAEYMLLMFLVIICFDKIIEKDSNSEFVLKIFTCLLPIFAIFSGNVVSTRFKDYFTITYGIILMYLCQIDEGRKKYIVQLCTVAICAYGYFRYIINFDAGGLMPYVTFVSKGIGIFN